MAEREDSEKSGGDASVSPPVGAAPVPQDLPAVEAPPLSPEAGRPTGDAPKITVDPAAAPAPNLVTAKRRLLRPRHKRMAVLAASVTLAAAVGALVGAAATSGLSKSPTADVASLEERKAMQQAITHLAKEVTTLKSSVDASNKSAHTQIAKLSERLARESAEVTGSISPPQTTAPVPTPRPAPRSASADTAPPRAPVVQGWSIRDMRDGYIYVEGKGEVYQVVPGAPLPGIGPVESVKRQDGRWVVVTPKGLIVAARDRRYFESF